MGKRFKQRQMTVHLAVDLLDRYFFAEGNEFESGVKTKFLLTTFMIASKYDELDDNIPLIKELQRYFTRTLHHSQQVPTFDDIVECERLLMKFYGWDLMMLTPSHFLDNFLANGVLYDCEDTLGGQSAEQKVEKASRLTTKISEINEMVMKNPTSFGDKKASLVAAAIVFVARKRNLPDIEQHSNFAWCPALEELTSYNQADMAEVAKSIEETMHQKKQDQLNESKEKENLSNSVAQVVKTSPVRAPFRQTSNTYQQISPKNSALA